jgi:glycosyltransferase involved in cell wall biosynthesis
LVPPADALALADALAALYHDPGRAARLAEAGRGLVLREFELSANVRQLAALFEGVVKTEPWEHPAAATEG